jgi:hypothetical protein
MHLTTSHQDMEDTESKSQNEDLKLGSTTNMSVKSLTEAYG